MDLYPSKKRLVQSLIVAVALVAMLTTTLFGSSSSTSAEEIELIASRTAGITAVVNAFEMEAVATATVEASNVTVVASSFEAADEAEAEEAEETEEFTVYNEETSEDLSESIIDTTNAEWADKLMADVSKSLNVREEADAESEIVGKMYQGDVATILAVEGDWYYITSGNVTGYVSAEYCVVGESAHQLALEVCYTYAKALTGGVRVRSEASTESSIYTNLGLSDEILVDVDAEEVEGWVAVIYNSKTGYVCAEYVSVYTDYGTAITIEEENAAAAAAAAAAAEAAAKQQAVATQNAALAAAADDVTLLAALIQAEAGGECYEGKVAVGAVVVNRVRSGSYPSSIYNVIYQSGQFSTAKSGKVASIIASGPNSTCIAAAEEALSGYDPTGGALGFRPKSSGRSGVIIGNHVFF